MKKKAEEAKKKAEEAKKLAAAHKAEEAKKKAEEAKKLAAKKKAEEAKKKAEGAKGSPTKPAQAPKPKLTKFVGMVDSIPGGNEGKFTVKHANGTIKTFPLTGSTKVVGLATSVKGVAKGQIVHVHSRGKETVKIDVVKKAEPTKKLVGKDHFRGVVTAVKTDSYGDNGTVWVKNYKGVTKRFRASNATSVDAKKGKQTIVHSLQGLQKGQNVHVLSAGADAVEIHIILK